MQLPDPLIFKYTESNGEATSKLCHIKTRSNKLKGGSNSTDGVLDTPQLVPGISNYVQQGPKKGATANVETVQVCKED